MVFDIVLILKSLWALVTCILLGALKIFYADFKKMQDRQDELEKDIIRLRSDMITKDNVDILLDRKIKHISDNLGDTRAEIADMRADITDLRKEVKEDNYNLQKEIRAVLNAMLEHLHR